MAGPLTSSPVGVTNGLFTVTLDFGPGVFNRPWHWLDIAVRTSGGGVFTPLSPRQPLNPVPYAQYALNANTAHLATGLASGVVTSEKIADGTILLSKLSASGSAAGQVLLSQGGRVV